MKPKITFVATTRNDNHGGDLLKRTTVFINGIKRQSYRYQLHLELIIVEWNPPLGKALLNEELSINSIEHEFLKIRFIIVPPEVHSSYKTSSSMPLYQMIAKNVGIRRANSDFILCTNIDLLFSDDLFKFLSESKLNTEFFYRANRVDVDNGILFFDKFDDQITFAKNHIIKKLGKNKGHEYLFGLPSFVYGFTNTVKILNLIFKWGLYKLYPNEEAEIRSLDKEACGDFTLMSKSAWMAIEGYPELDMYSIHIDTMAIIAARALGFQQFILSQNECVYHIFHSEGWESYDNNPVELIKFIEKRPGLDWGSVEQAGKWLLKQKRSWGLNKQDWGFANLVFPEVVIEFNNGKRVLNF